MHITSQIICICRSEKLVIDSVSRQFKIALLQHSVLYFNGNTDLSFLVYLITQAGIFQLQKTDINPQDF